MEKKDPVLASLLYLAGGAPYKPPERRYASETECAASSDFS